MVLAIAIADAATTDALLTADPGFTDHGSAHTVPTLPAASSDRALRPVPCSATAASSSAANAAPAAITRPERPCRPWCGLTIEEDDGGIPPSSTSSISANIDLKVLPRNFKSARISGEHVARVN